jgi:hypothetical protein
MAFNPQEFSGDRIQTLEIIEQPPLDSCLIQLILNFKNVHWIGSMGDRARDGKGEKAHL